MKTGAVLTGDIIGSTKSRGDFLAKMKTVLQDVDHKLSAGAGQYEIYRGDSFQYVPADPARSLEAAVLIRAGLKTERVYARHPVSFDAKISIGIGNLATHSPRPGESNDEAFILSGRMLDKLEHEKYNLAVSTELQSFSGFLEVITRWVDDMVTGWSDTSADTCYIYWMKELNQSEIATRFGITQPGVHKRLQQAKVEQIELCKHHYQQILKELISGTTGSIA